MKTHSAFVRFKILRSNFKNPITGVAADFGPIQHPYVDDSDVGNGV
jgi:hypothetical protein